MSKAKRRYLLALAFWTVCRSCKSAPGHESTECGPCMVKRVDEEREGTT